MNPTLAQDITVPAAADSAAVKVNTTGSATSAAETAMRANRTFSLRRVLSAYLRWLAESGELKVPPSVR